MKKVAILFALILSGGFIYRLSSASNEEELQNKEISPLVEANEDLTIWMVTDID